MKKWLCLLLCFAMMFTLAGCKEKGSSDGTGGTGTAPAADGSGTAPVSEDAGTASASEDAGTAQASEDVATAPASEDAGTASASEDAATVQSDGNDAAEKAAVSTEKIDVDLTQLSSTMVYSEVYNMMVSPEDYIGKTVKIEGTFAYYHDEAVDNYYFACMIADAAACCSQGIEFVLAGDYTYPEDYPEAGEEICVSGVFDTYEEGETTFCTLTNASFI